MKSKAIDKKFLPILIYSFTINKGVNKMNIFESMQMGMEKFVSPIAQKNE